MDTWQAIDSGSEDDARELLGRACGASRWVERMMQQRPFGSREALRAAAGAVWNALGERDWREAFAHHPKIGDRAALDARFPNTHELSAHEQSGVDGAPAAVLDALAEANLRYEERFGYIFIICATGLTAAQMLDALAARLRNPPDEEIRLAAAEQLEITRLRLS